MKRKNRYGKINKETLKNAIQPVSIRARMTRQRSHKTPPEVGLKIFPYASIQEERDTPNTAIRMMKRLPFAVIMVARMM